MSVLLGYTKHWWQGLAIVLSSLSAGAPSFGGLGGCFMCMYSFSNVIYQVVPLPDVTYPVTLPYF